MNKPQIIYGPNGPAFVVLPVEDFLALSPQSETMLSDEQLYDLAKARDDGAHVPHDVVKRLIEGENPLKVYREWRNMTQTDLAQKTNVSSGYISQVERGTRQLSRRKLATFAEALDINADDLISA
jgi:DNA-binding XRE family transcriptional regulator